MRRRHTPISIIIIFLVLIVVMGMSCPISSPAEPTGDSQLSSGPSETPAPTPEPTPEPTLEPTPEPTPEPTVPAMSEIPTIYSPNAFVYDCRTDTFLYTRGDPDAKLYIASVTKLFTAYVALQYLDPNATITVGEILETVPSDSSTAMLSLRDKMTVKDFIYGMLLPSGNDAARVVAVEVGKIIAGTSNQPETTYMALFVEEMNTQAEILGLTGSHFVTPDGYHDPEHYSSLTDMATIGKLCLETPLIMEVAGTDVHRATLLNNGKELLWINGNRLLHEKRYDPSYYNEAALGLKTGYTSHAGHCLLSAFAVEDGYVLIGIFGNGDSPSRYTDTLKLFDAITYK